MTPVGAAKKILDTMLGHLGFHVDIEVHDSDDEPCLQIHTPRSELLIGKDGERLDDLQYLVNRVLKKHFPKAPRVRIDCEHYRAIQEDKLTAEVRGAAEAVKASGKPFKMRPLNAYYRRTGVPSLINTSFNLHGEPIVCTPADAVRSFQQGHLDYLAIGPFLVGNPRAQARAAQPAEAMAGSA